MGLSPFRKATLPSSSPSIRAELVIAGKAMAPRPVPKKAFGSAFGAGLPLIVMARAARKKSVTWGDLGWLAVLFLVVAKRAFLGV